MSSNMKPIKELQEFIIKHYTNEDGDIDIQGLNFEGKTILLDKMLAKYISQEMHRAEKINQSRHRAEEVNQYSHKAKEIRQAWHIANNVSQSDKYKPLNKKKYIEVERK